MTTNMGRLDRGLRIAVGLVALGLAFLSSTAFASGVLFWVALVFGLVMLVTSVVGFCPLYPLVGLSTKREG